MEKSIHFVITPIWSVIRQIRKKVASDLAGFATDDELDDTLICAVELVENAAKYSESTPNMKNIQFFMQLENRFIEIEVSNGVVRSRDLDNVTRILDDINSGADPEQLYLSRLNELRTAARHDQSQLGLLRIANETGYSLTYTVNQNILTILARRKIHE